MSSVPIPKFGHSYHRATYFQGHIFCRSSNFCFREKSLWKKVAMCKLWKFTLPLMDVARGENCFRYVNDLTIRQWFEDICKDILQLATKWKDTSPCVFGNNCLFAVSWLIAAVTRTYSRYCNISMLKLIISVSSVLTIRALVLSSKFSNKSHY